MDNATAQTVEDRAAAKAARQVTLKAKGMTTATRKKPAPASVKVAKSASKGIAKATKPKPAKAAPEKPVVDLAAIEAKQAAAIKSLNPIATKVNAFFDRAATSDKRSDDLRLSAARELVEAEKIADEAGMKFKDWYGSNIIPGPGRSWETARKLLAVAKSPDPVQAIADLRERNKVANQKLNAKKAEGSKSAPLSRQLPSPSSKPGESPESRALQAALALKPDTRTNLAKSMAETLGLVVMTKEEAETAKPTTGIRTRLEIAKEAFDSLKSDEDRQELLVYVAKKVGAALGEMPTAAKDDLLQRKPTRKAAAH